VKLKPTIVSAPKLIFAESPNKSEASPDKEGAWNLAEQKSFLQKGAPCSTLHVIYLTLEMGLGEFVGAIGDEMLNYSLAKNITINFSVPELAPSPPKPASPKEAEDSKKEYRTKCQSILNKAFSSLNEKPSNIPFMLVVLPERSILLYPEVKRWGDCVVGIPTVCITSNKLKQVTSNDKTAPMLRANIWYASQVLLY
jgi:hypothetical protein